MRWRPTDFAGRRPRARDQSVSVGVKRSMDGPITREIWLLALGAILLEVLVAAAAFVLLAQ